MVSHQSNYNKDNDKSEDGAPDSSDSDRTKSDPFRNTYLNLIKNVWSSFLYDILLGFFDVAIQIFFRDIECRSGFLIPKKGPVIFVIAPHANQFIDPVVTMAKVKKHSGRRISFLMAKKSYKQLLIGSLAYCTSPIVVDRGQDLLRPAKGKIYVKDAENGGIEVDGEDTRFTDECEEKGLIGNSYGHVQIKTIISDTKLILRSPLPHNPKSSNPRERFAAESLKTGSEYSVAPYVDNNKIFQDVFHHLQDGKILGIFPEGGSHDRTDLLPLRPGVAIMALGAAAQSKDPDFNVNVVPVGLNYFHPDKFRSRVVIEFGQPIRVNKELGDRYEKDRRGEVGKLLKNISLNLKDVTVTCSDYETLKVVHVARRLYTSAYRNSISLPYVLEMNRKIVKLFEEHSGNERVIELRKSLLDYSKRLDIMGLHDYQVPNLTMSNRFEIFITLCSRLTKTLVFCSLSLPGVILFSPVFIAAKRYSRKKAKEALINSDVKIKAIDVIGSWKVIVALLFAPCLYTFYSFIGVQLFTSMNILPVTTPAVAVFLLCFGLSVLTTYSSMRVGEIGVDCYKSLKPLIYSVLSQHWDILQIEDLKANRQELATRIVCFFERCSPDIVKQCAKLHESTKENIGYEDSDFLLNSSHKLSHYSQTETPVFSNFPEDRNDESPTEVLS